MQDYQIKHLLNTFSTQSGLYGVFANPGFGTTTLLMQIARGAVDINGGTAIVFSLDLSQERWYDRMRSIGLSLDRISVTDTPGITDQIIEDTIKDTENPGIIVIDYLNLLEPNTAQKLKGISAKYSIPIFVCGYLTRDSGDYDPNGRPELISAKCLYGSRQIISFQEFDFLALLHRGHDCDRNIGTAYRYNISNTSELIIKINWFGDIGSVFFKWDEQRKCFDI